MKSEEVEIKKGKIWDVKQNENTYEGQRENAVEKRKMAMKGGDQERRCRKKLCVHINKSSWRLLEASRRHDDHTV